MSKQKRTKFILSKTVIKISFFITFLCAVWLDFFLTIGITQHLLFLYGFVVFVCSVSFVGTFFKKIRKISYIALSIGLIVYIMLNLVPEIADKLEVDKCLDNGGAWDYEQRSCL